MTTPKNRHTRLQELLRYDAAEGIETVHPVTPYLCRTDQRGPHLSAGVVTALFDEVKKIKKTWRLGKKGLGPPQSINPDNLPTSIGSTQSHFLSNKQVSTAACILQDKTHRPGVSVALDVEMLAHDVGTPFVSPPLSLIQTGDQNI